MSGFFWLASSSAVLTLGLTGCSVAGAAAGAAISIGGAVVSTGISLTGKAIGAGIDAVSASPESSDSSGIIVRERIGPAAGSCQPAVGEAMEQPCT